MKMNFKRWYRFLKQIIGIEVGGKTPRISREPEITQPLAHSQSSIDEEEANRIRNAKLELMKYQRIQRGY